MLGLATSWSAGAGDGWRFAQRWFRKCGGSPQPGHDAHKPEDDHRPGRITYLMEGEVEQTHAPKLKARIMLEQAGFTPADDYRLIREQPRHEYAPDDVVEIHEGEQFEIHHNQAFDINVILTTTKVVKVHPKELVEKAKKKSLSKFDIPKSSAPEYKLATSLGNPAARLDDSKTIEQSRVTAGATLYLVKPHDDA